MNQTKTAGSSTFASEQPSHDVSSNATHLNRDRDTIAATNPLDSGSADFKTLQRDLNNLKDTVTNFIARTTNEAAKSARELRTSIVGQASDVADMGADVASTAGRQAKSLANEFEAMARRNPLGVIAGALVVGVLIGLMGRRS
jgi:ElaB/YqjD/DUF883 family membrane-anchored ribosome-binding protein